MLTPATILALVAACWAHPQGVAYLEKIDQIEQLSISCGNPCCTTGGGGNRKLTEKELWANLPEPYVFKPKVKEVKVEVVNKVFLPSSEVSPEEVASVAKEVAKKFVKSKVIVIDEDDDEEAILFLLGVL
jgi:hypothetical protein